MRLTKQQREVMDAWMSENMMTGDHCIVWATEELAPLLGLGDDISSNWGVLHPLAFEVRKWCKEHKAKPPKRMEPTVEFGWEKRKEAGWNVNPTHEVECIRCGATFETTRRNAKRCPDCIAKGLDAHPRRGADAYGSRRCAICNETFEPKAHNQKYCSKLCKAKANQIAKRDWWRREHDVEPDAKPTRCVVCGREFTPTSAHVNASPCCSDECRAERKRQYNRQLRAMKKSKAI